MDSQMTVCLLDDHTARITIEGVGEVLVYRFEERGVGPGIRVAVDAAEGVPVEVDQ